MKPLHVLEPGVYLVAVEYRCERAMRRILEISVEYVMALAAGVPYPIDERVAEVKAIVSSVTLKPVRHDESPDQGLIRASANQPPYHGSDQRN